MPRSLSPSRRSCSEFGRSRFNQAPRLPAASRGRSRTLLAQERRSGGLDVAQETVELGHQLTDRLPITVLSRQLQASTEVAEPPGAHQKGRSLQLVAGDPDLQRV